MRVRIKRTDVRELLFNTFKLKKGTTWKEIRKEFGIPKSTFEKYKSGEFCMSKELFLDLLKDVNKSVQDKVLANSNELPDNFGYVLGGKKFYQKNKNVFQYGRERGMAAINIARNNFEYTPNIFASKELTPSMCEVVGAFIGDGCFNCYKNKLYQVSFAGDSRKDIPYYEQIIIPSLKSLFPNLKPHIYTSKSKNSVNINFYSKELFYFFKEGLGFIPGKKAYTVAIPQKIFTLGDKHIRATIRGIFDTDGCVFFDRRNNYKNAYPRISLHIKSKPLHEQLHFYLSKLFSLYSKFNLKRQIYIIDVYGMEQFKKWMSLIGFSNKRHLNRINLPS